jgi:hypothetical protein
MGTVLKVGLGIVLGVFLLIAGCAALFAASSGVDTSDPQVEEGGGNSGGGGGGDKPKTAGVGDRLTLTGTTYEVTSAKSASTVGDDEFTRTKANGEFIVIKLKLTNRKDEPATISESAIKVIGGNKKQYSTSSDALLAFPDQTFILEEIQPDVTKGATLVYDVPESAVSKAKLQVEDLFSDAKGQVRLGL